jgi:hypothetical protein
LRPVAAVRGLDDVHLPQAAAAAGDLPLEQGELR